MNVIYKQKYMFSTLERQRSMHVTYCLQGRVQDFFCEAEQGGEWLKSIIKDYKMTVHSRASLLVSYSMYND